MRDLTAWPFPGQDSLIGDAEVSSGKAQCKADFKYVLDQIKTYQRTHDASNEDVDILYAAVISCYVGCLLETEFEATMTKWSSRLLRRWLQYEGE